MLFKANEHGRIKAFLAVLRDERALSFESVGDPKKAVVRTETALTWEVKRPGHATFRIMAEGRNGRVRAVSIFRQGNTAERDDD